jgi:1-acyl-sn-glycerol-3-phosphate acyltransferase
MNPLYQAVYHLVKFLGSVFFSFRVVYPERIIEEGPAILAMNHQSFLDPPLAGICCQRELNILARKSLLKWPIIGAILPRIRVIPVDLSGGGDMSALKSLIRILRKNEATLMFPEGTRTPDGNLLPARSGIGFVIAKTLAPVVPMRIFGAFEALPRSGKEFHATPITIVIGKPLYFTKADLEVPLPPGVDIYQHLANRVMEAIAAIQYEE